MASNLAQTPDRFRGKLMRVVRSRTALKAVVVVVAALAMVMVTVRTGRWVTVRQLAARIHASDDSTAAQLVAQLAAFGETAYPVLVVAANSKRSQVALAARSQIDELVDEWQQAAYLHPATFALDGTALPLAGALESEISSMTSSGRRWARGVLASLVSLADRQPFADRLALIRIYDRVLSSLPADETVLPFDADVDYRLTLAPPPRESIFDAPTMVEEPRSIDLPVPPRADAPHGSEADAPASEETRGDSESPATVSSPEDRPSTTELRVVRPSPLPTSPNRITASAVSSRLAPPPTALDGNLPEVDVSDTPPLDDHVDQRLFDLLASGEPQKQQAAADALLVRGYGHVTPLDARMLISPSLADRLALIDQLMTSSRLEAGKWLWKLAHDPAGEVRAAAIASISTSGDRQLIAATLKLALRDSDPRVAAHSQTLQKMLK